MQKPIATPGRLCEPGAGIGCKLVEKGLAVVLPTQACLTGNARNSNGCDRLGSRATRSTTPYSTSNFSSIRPQPQFALHVPSASSDLYLVLYYSASASPCLSKSYFFPSSHPHTHHSILIPFYPTSSLSTYYSVLTSQVLPRSNTFNPFRCSNTTYNYL